MASFQNEVPIFFKKFKVKKKIGQGAFGSVFSGKNIAENKPVAIKVEKSNAPRTSLKEEAFLLLELKGLGIPEMISFGKVKTYNVLVEPLLGQSLFNLFIQAGMQFALEDICLIAIQVIERIQFVHSRFIIHRDIKPDNFLIGQDDPNIIYIVDFGLSKKYRSSATKRHVPFRITGKLTGTMRFSSPNALRGGEQSRKDDLISIGYMIIYFMRKKLPWQQFNRVKNEIERYIKIYKMKKELKPEILCNSLPQEMAQYMRYVQHLGFEEEPDYKYMKDLFKGLLKRRNANYDRLLFSWIKASDIPKLKKPVNPSSRRSSSRERLWKKINDNIKKKNNRDVSSDSSENHSFETAPTVKINPPNIQMVRTNSRDTFDVSMQSSENNFKTGNTNTLFVNFDKTMNNKLMESIKIIDQQFDSKDSKSFPNEIISQEKEKYEENKKNILSNLKEKEERDSQDFKNKIGKPNIKTNEEKKSEEHNIEMLKLKNGIKNIGNIKQVKNKKNMTKEQMNQIQENLNKKNEGMNKLLNNMNMKEDMNKNKVKDNMINAKNSNLNNIQNGENHSNKKVLFNNNILNMVNRLNQYDNNSNHENLKGNNNQNNKDMIYNNQNQIKDQIQNQIPDQIQQIQNQNQIQNIPTKNNVHKKNRTNKMNNIDKNQKLNLENINNNNKVKMIKKNNNNTTNDKYMQNVANTENNKKENNLLDKPKKNKNLIKKHSDEPNFVAFTEPSDSIQGPGDIFSFNQTDNKNYNINKKKLYKGQNNTTYNLMNNNNFEKKFNYQLEQIGNNNFPGDSEMNEKSNLPQKNVLKKKNNNMNKQNRNNNLRQFNNNGEINKNEYNNRNYNMHQLNNFDGDRKDYVNYNQNSNKKQDMMKQQKKKMKNFNPNNNNYNMKNNNSNFTPINNNINYNPIFEQYPQNNNIDQQYKNKEPLANNSPLDFYDNF